MKKQDAVRCDGLEPHAFSSSVELSATPPASETGFSRKPLEATVDRGTAAQLFAQEAEYYQDITFPATESQVSSRMIVDVLDTLSIGSGTAIPEDKSDQARVFTETLVVSQFKAKSVLIACNTLSGAVGDGNKRSCITVSPAPKSDFDTAQVNGPGKAGARGDDAGDIMLFVESIDETKPDAFPLLDARGGRGQNGQHSQNDVGGAPGYGGNGGNITVVYGSPIKRAIVVIQDALNNLDGPNARLILSALKALSNQDMKLPSGKTLGKQVSDEDPFVQAMRDLFLSTPQDESDKRSPNFTQKLKLITDTLAMCIDTLNTHILRIETDVIYPKILNKAGDTGNYGSGPKGASSDNPNGQEPKDGNILVKAVAGLSELPWASDNGIDCRTIVSDMQAAMLLQKAKMSYFYGDVSEAKETAEAAKILLDRLVSRLSFVGKMTAPDEKADPTGGFARLQSVLNQATAYQTQFDHGLDYYGHAYGQVPLLTLERYQAMVNDLSRDFAAIETHYAEYFTYLIENKAEMSQLKAASDKLGTANDQLEKDQQILRESAGRMAYDISCLTDSLAFKRNTLDMAMSKFEGKLNDYFNCDFKALLSGLSTIAFAPNSGMMWATQAASWLYNGFTTIPNDSGEAINKDYVVQKVASVEANVKAIIEGFKQLNSGLFEADDPGANKLIAAQEDLKKFLDDFSSKFKDEVESIKDAFDDYVSAVTERNNKILSYNAAISLILKKKRQVVNNKTHQQDIQKQMADNASPALPAMTASMSVFYHTVRDQLMELLYQMTRAYQFRALDNTNLIAQYMKAHTLTPATMTKSAISTMYANSGSMQYLTDGIAWKWYEAQENMGGDQISVFPKKPDTWGAQYHFTEPEILETFKQVRTLNKTQVHSVLLSIPTVYPYSSADYALAGMSDIRLTNVRAWLDGVKVVGRSPKDTPRLLIDIIHTGRESIVNPGGGLFFFFHEPVTKFFSYFPNKLPANSNTFPKDAIFADSEIEKTGDQPTYALIGPFTTWEVRLTNSYMNKVGLIDEMKNYKNLPASYQGMEGKDIMCEYPSHAPIMGKVGKVNVTNEVITLEIQNIVGRIADILKVEGMCVTSQNVLKGAEVPNPNENISFSSDSQGPKLDFSNFTGICLEFSGKGRAFQ